MNKYNFDFQEPSEDITNDKPRVVKKYFSNNIVDEEEDERQS